MFAKTILVTGGCGFIGSHLVEALLERNDLDKVVVVDDLSNSSTWSLSHIPQPDPRLLIVPIDFADKDILKQIESGTFTHVFHLAAKASVPYSMIEPVSTTDNNVMRTVRLLNACAKGKTSRFIFSSSSAIYGNTQRPMSEDTVPDPLSPYALQKLTVEQYCKLYSTIYGLDTVSLRYFNVFGPRQSGKGDYANVIGAWSVAIANATPSSPPVFKIYGTGEQRRDFVHVGKVVRANLAAMDHKKDFGGLSLNVGSGWAQTINSVFELFKKHTNSDYTPIYLPARNGDVLGTISHQGLASLYLGKDIGWDAKHEFEKRLADTIKSYVDVG